MPSTACLITHKIENFISRYWLPTGCLVLLTGLFWLPERSLFSKTFYVLIASPALLVMLTCPRKAAHLFREPVIISFLIFAAWLITSTFWSSSDHSQPSQIKRPLYVLMLFAGCAFIALSQHRLTLEKTLFYASLITTLAAGYSLFLFLSDPSQARLIGSGSLSNPLLTSHLLGFACAYWLARWTCAQPHQTLAILCGTILLIALLATGSRTPLFALAVTSLWLACTWRTRRAVLPIVLLVIGTLMVLILTPDLFTNRGFSHRPEIWSKAFRQIMETPWLGHGYGSPLAIWVPDLAQTLSDPHNVELAVAYELGAIGLLLWCLIYAAALAPCIRYRASPEFAIASALLIYGLMAGMTEGSNFLSRPNESWFLTWIPLALIASLSIRKRLEQTGR
jgi:O-antigen ligase